MDGLSPSKRQRIGQQPKIKNEDGDQTGKTHDIQWLRELRKTFDSNFAEADKVLNSVADKSLVMEIWSKMESMSSGFARLMHHAVTNSDADSQVKRLMRELKEKSEENDLLHNELIETSQLLKEKMAEIAVLTTTSDHSEWDSVISALKSLADRVDPEFIAKFGLDMDSITCEDKKIANLFLLQAIQSGEMFTCPNCNKEKEQKRQRLHFAECHPKACVWFLAIKTARQKTVDQQVKNKVIKKLHYEAAKLHASAL